MKSVVVIDDAAILGMWEWARREAAKPVAIEPSQPQFRFSTEAKIRALSLTAPDVDRADLFALAAQPVRYVISPGNRLLFNALTADC
jgi:hypothetical protein